MAEKNVKFYKTKDGTIVYCKDEVARQGVEELQGIWEAIEELPDGQAVSAEVAIHTTQIEKLKKGKANINGNYDSMTVGMAKNIEANEIVSGIFKYRPTAGNAECDTGVAKVRSIKGNAVAMNQILQNGNFESTSGWNTAGFYGGTMSVSNNIATVSLVNGACDTAHSIPALIVGHKYYVSVNVNGEGSFTGRFSGLSNQNIFAGVSITTWTRLSSITEAAYANTTLMFFFTSATQNLQLKNCIIIDLTLMFGAGNEPSSVEAFEGWLQANVGLQDYYPYNAGELLAAKMLGLKTVGFNQWDEEWEVGRYDSGTGQKATQNDTIRSIGYIPCYPDTTYYAKLNGRVFYYDGSFAFISTVAINNTTITTPANCKYITFNAYFGYGTTYNHDICINLHYTNGRDGEYEPYEENNYNFDTSKVYGKLNGEGNYVQVFPDGLKSAGSIRDELTIKGGVAKVIKRVGSVDLGSLTYSWRGDGTISSQDIVDYKLALNVPALCSSYQYRGTVQGIAQMSTGDKQIALFYNGDGTTRYLYIRDTSLSSSDVSQQGVVSKFSGVLLFYELAEPSEYTDLVYRDNGVDVPLLDHFSGVILVDNYGTEEQLLESPTDNNPNSCAAGMDIVYGVNAADFIDSANNGAFISKASMDAFLNALGSAMNGTWSSTWDATNGRYSYTFTPNS